MPIPLPPPDPDESTQARKRRVHIAIMPSSLKEDESAIVWSIATEDIIPAGRESLLGLGLMGAELPQRLLRGLENRFSMEDPSDGRGGFSAAGAESVQDFTGIEVSWGVISVSERHKKPWTKDKSIAWVEAQIIADFPQALRFEAPRLFHHSFDMRREAHIHVANQAFEVERANEIAAEIGRGVAPVRPAPAGSKPRI